MGEIVRAGIPALRQRAGDRTQLWNWFAAHLELHIPNTAVCLGHQAPFDYVAAACLEPARDLVVWAPRGGGKTRLAAAVTLYDLLTKPGCQVRILGGSLEQSLHMWDHLCPDVERLLQPPQARIRARRVRVTGGASAGVLTQSQRAVRGQRVQKLRCDEVELFDPQIWQAAQLVTRSLRGSGPHDAVAGAIEALSTHHIAGGLMGKVIDEAQSRGTTVIRWCLLEVLQRCPPERQCEACPLWEDCRGVAKEKCDGFLSIDDAIALKRRVSRDTWEAEMLCLRPSRQDSVFRSFDPALHVREMEPQLSDPWLAIDFGYHSPFVCLWVVPLPNGHVHVLDEYSQEGQRVEDHLREIERRTWPRALHVACDPAGSAPNDQTARSNVDLIKSRGYRVHTRHSHIIDGLEAIRTALMSGERCVRLTIHPRCKRLIAAMKSYRFGKHGGENPLKDGVFDHAIDALRYYFVNTQRDGKAKASAY